MQKTRQRVRKSAKSRVKEQETPATSALEAIAPDHTLTVEKQPETVAPKPAVKDEVRPAVKDEPKTGQTERLPMSKALRQTLAAAAYLNILILIPMLWKRQDDFVDHHVRQGLALFMTGVAMSFVAWGSFALWIVTTIGYVALCAYASVQAASGREWNIPLVHRFMKRIAL